VIYLDNAATSYPKPKEVSQAVLWALANCGNPGRSGHELALNAGRTVLGCRQALADLLHVDDPFRIVFCYNCTDALNLAIRGMVREGGHVIATVWEHNSALRPLFSLVRRGVVTWTVVEPGADGVVTAAAIRAAILPHTCLAVVNQVSNVTGIVQPVDEIAAVCRELRVPLLVDGAQAVGHLPVDLKRMDPDLYAFPGHKGLLGPQGTGALYIGKNAWPEPLREGGTGSVSRQLIQPDDIPDRYESGTPATPCLAGLWAGAQYVSERMPELQAHCERILALQTEGLREIPGVRVYLPMPNGRRRVLQRGGPGIHRRGRPAFGQIRRRLPSRFHCAPLAHRFLGTDQTGTVRMSPGPFTTERDVRAALRAVERISVGSVKR
jgi:selenocysteine lyase/cysteine desulfurase